MNCFIVGTVSSFIAFLAGVIFHKYFLDRTSAIKQHFTDELLGAERRIRRDLGSLLEKFPKL